MKKTLKTFAFFATCVVIFFAAANIFAQKTKIQTNTKPSNPAAVSNIPKVTQIDEVKIKELLKPNGKPLLVNFWATWCIPCREEFPELVEIDKEYKGKIDFITISLDDLAEINRDVPKFLNEMKATMPAYLLKTTDENAVISSISKDWAGGLPFSVLYNKDGEIVHFKQGKIKIDVVKEKLNTLLLNSEEDENFIKGKKDALNDLSEGKLILRNHSCKSQIVNKSDLFKRRGLIILGEVTEPKPKPDENEPKFELECKSNANFQEIRYMEGYNSISQPEILKFMGIDYRHLRQFGLPINYPPKINEVILTKK